MLYTVYFLTNKYNNVLYIGITGDIEKRLYEHRNQLVNGFTKKYQTKKCVYMEHFEDVEKAILREKQLKKWVRRKKDALVNKVNPNWIDVLSIDGGPSAACAE